MASYKLLFKKDNPIIGITASPIMVVPSQCTHDGGLFVEMVDPADPRQHTVYSVLKKKSQRFSLDSISDLHDVQMFSFFPSGATVSFLVFGTRENTASPATVTGTNGETNSGQRNHGEHHFYIAKFNLDGSYKESVELSFQYPLFRVAALGSGEFLISGYDQPNDTPRLLLLDAKGSRIRSIDLPTSRQARTASSEQSGEPGELTGAIYVSSLTFIPYKEDVLIWRTGSNEAVMQVGAGGSVREAPITAPKGYVLVDLVPSDEQWIGHFRTTTLPQNATPSEDDYVYYEINPSDGSLIRRLIVSGTNVGAISCRMNDTFIAVQTDENGKLIILSAN